MARTLAHLVVLFITLTGLTGCGDSTSMARISETAFDPETRMLEANLDITLSPVALDALDHGIPVVLEFVIDPEHGDSQFVRWELSYLPLMRRYQLLADGSAPRFFSSRIQLLAALDRFRIQLNDGLSGPGEIRVRLDSAALPAPMRLPALLESGWRLRAAPARWQAVP